MNIKFKNRQFENINFYKEPDATLFPLNKTNPNELILKGFTLRNKSFVEDIIYNKMSKYHLF